MPGISFCTDFNSRMGDKLEYTMPSAECALVHFTQVHCCHNCSHYLQPLEMVSLVRGHSKSMSD